MRRHIRASMAAVAMAFGIHVAAFAQGSITVDVVGAPANAIIDLALNGGKIADVSTGTDGSGTTTIDLGSGEQQIQVWVERCEDDKAVGIQMAALGREPQDDGACDRTLVGAFWSNRARRVAIDLINGRLKIHNRGLSRRVKLGIGAASLGAGALIAAGASGGGNGSDATAQQPPPAANPPTQPPPPPQLDPVGLFNATLAFLSGDPSHLPRIGLGSAGTLNVTRNSPVAINSPNITNWVPVTGEIDDSTGRFNLTGRGTVAGFQNVSVRFEGTITTSGQITGTYTMGAGGELPGGQSTSYSVQGQK